MLYFQRKEFECKCGCGFDTVDYELVRILDDVRAYFNKPVHITSGCRCISHNHTVGGSTYSKHVEGRAADFVVSGIDHNIVADYLENKYPDTYGIGRYDGRCHIDSREEPARWDERE